MLSHSQHRHHHHRISSHYHQEKKNYCSYIFLFYGHKKEEQSLKFCFSFSVFTFSPSFFVGTPAEKTFPFLPGARKRIVEWSHVVI